jgi:hypothetical protein
MKLAYIPDRNPSCPIITTSTLKLSKWDLERFLALEGLEIDVRALIEDFHNDLE